MPSQKRLNGLAHDIMDHAVSGLSYLQPHLAHVCKDAGVNAVTLDLLSDSPLPVELRSLPPAAFACEALHRTFLAILAKMEYSMTDIASATLTFEFPKDPAIDPYRFACVSEVVSANGRRYEHRMHTDTYFS